MKVKNKLRLILCFLSIFLYAIVGDLSANDFDSIVSTFDQTDVLGRKIRKIILPNRMKLKTN